MIKHPKAIGETYTTHAKHALWIASQTALITGALLIHALLPDVLVTYASDKLAAIESYRNKRKEK